MKKYDTDKSRQIYEELKDVLLDGVGSFFQKAEGEEYPIVMDHANGPYLYDVDGNEYIDFVNGLGPNILGGADPDWNRAVTEQLKKGVHMAAPTEALLELSKRLIQDIPCAEMVSFQNSGTEVNLFAFRVARAYTHKNVIIKFEGQYHGWADEEKISIDANSLEDLGDYEKPNKIIHNPGQPVQSTENILILPWNDADLLEKVLSERDDIAAIIMEPFMCDSGPINPAKDYLQRVRELTIKHHVVLIFDEVITGFHMALGGAQEYYGVTPDMATFAKALTAGLPMALCVGKKEIMQCGVHAAGTFNGNALGTAAALHTLSVLENPDVYKRFEKLGQMLCDGIEEAAARFEVPVYTHHAGAICTMLFADEKREMKNFRDCVEHLDFQYYSKVVELAKSYGVRLTPKRGRLYLSTAMTEKEILKTIEVLTQVFDELSAS